MKFTLLLLFTAVLLMPLALSSQAQDRDDRDRETMIDERFSVNEGGTLEVNVPPFWHDQPRRRIDDAPTPKSRISLASRARPTSTCATGATG